MIGMLACLSLSDPMQSRARRGSVSSFFVSWARGVFASYSATEVSQKGVPERIPREDLSPARPGTLNHLRQYRCCWELCCKICSSFIIVDSSYFPIFWYVFYICITASISNEVRSNLGSMMGIKTTPLPLSPPPLGVATQSGPTEERSRY